jgi:LEA14-like dessication related protein
MTRRLFILLLSFGLFGCDADMVKEFVAPPEVKNIQLANFSVEDKQAVFELSLYNPNPFPLPISGMAGDISLNNLHIGSLEAQSEQHLAAYGTQTVTLPVSLDPNALLEAAKSVLLQGKANYNFNGNVSTSLGQVPFTKEGELSAKDILSSIMKLR